MVLPSKLLPILLCSTALVACGGGGGGNTAITAVATTQKNGTAEGFWTGTITGGFIGSVAVLENGETWGVYQSGNALVGAVYGTTTSVGATLTGAGTAFNFFGQTSSSASYTGTVAEKASLVFKTNETVPTIFTGKYDSMYDQPASLANIAGNYTGFSITATTLAQSVPVTVSASGLVTGNYVTGSLNCFASGMVKPRPSGKNIFDIQVTFSGNACALGNGTSVSGVATYDVTSKEVIVMALTPAKNDGFIYVGKR